MSAFICHTKNPIVIKELMKTSEITPKHFDVGRLINTELPDKMLKSVRREEIGRRSKTTFCATVTLCRVSCSGAAETMNENSKTKTIYNILTDHLTHCTESLKLDQNLSPNA